MKRTQFFVYTLITLLSFSAVAETKNKPDVTNNPTVEQRQKMADLHEKMAACLRSERPFSECRQEMMKNCKDAMGKSGCPMMGGGMGRGRHPMMDEKTTGKE